MTDNEEMLDAEYARVLALEASTDAEILLRKGGAWEALIEKARDEALGALNGLVSTEFTSLTEVKEMQWRVTRYDALCRWINQIAEAGEAATEDLSDDEADELKAMIQGETELKDA